MAERAYGTCEDEKVGGDVEAAACEGGSPGTARPTGRERVCEKLLEQASDCGWLIA